MELLPLDLKDKDRDKLQDGFGVALVATTKGLITKIGADLEIAYNPLDHVFPLKMTMQWTHPLSSAKRPMTKNMKNIAKQADTLNVGSKAILFAIAQTRNLAFAQLVLSKSKMIMIL